MRALESQMGCRLFTRMRKSVIPTEAGEALLHHAKLGLIKSPKGREMLEHVKEWGVRRICLGAPPLPSDSTTRYESYSGAVPNEKSHGASWGRTRRDLLSNPPPLSLRRWFLPAFSVGYLGNFFAAATNTR
jgi:DNA-binding transcriptional LysR family regulator